MQEMNNIPPRESEIEYAKWRLDCLCRVPRHQWTPLDEIEWQSWERELKMLLEQKNAKQDGN